MVLFKKQQLHFLQKTKLRYFSQLQTNQGNEIDALIVQAK